MPAVPPILPDEGPSTASQGSNPLNARAAAHLLAGNGVRIAAPKCFSHGPGYVVSTIPHSLGTGCRVTPLDHRFCDVQVLVILVSVRRYRATDHRLDKANIPLPPRFRSRRLLPGVLAWLGRLHFGSIGLWPITHLDFSPQGARLPAF